jgi:hypothetical protein
MLNAKFLEVPGNWVSAVDSVEFPALKINPVRKVGST